MSAASDALIGPVELKDGQFLSVLDGTVDVFVQTDGGALVPFASVADGVVLTGSSAPMRLVAVPRQGAELRAVAPAPLAAFGEAIAAARGLPKPPFADGSDADAGTVLAGLAEDARSNDAKRRAEAASASLEASAALVTEGLDRAMYSATSLGNMDTELMQSPLVAALHHLGRHMGFTVVQPSSQELENAANPLQVIAHKSSLRFRQVHLEENWQSGGVIPLLGMMRVDGSVRPMPVALVHRRGRYHVQRPDDAHMLPLTQDVSSRLMPVALEFYAPLPTDQPVTVRDILKQVSIGSSGRWILALVMALGIVLLGMVTPALTNVIIGRFVPQGASTLLIEAGVALGMCALGTFVFAMVQNFAISSISQVATRNLQSAFWGRLLSLPAEFFRQFNSGDLTIRTLAVDTLAGLLSVQVVSSALGAIFGLLYIVQMMTYGFWLGVAGALVMLATIAVLLVGLKALNRQTSASMASTRAANGWLVQMLNGMSKIRIAHAEGRMAARYIENVRSGIVAQARMTTIAGRLATWMVFAASAAPALYYLVVLWTWSGAAPSVSSATYMAFFSSASLAFAAVSGLSGMIPSLANVSPTLALLRPIMDAVPETSEASLDPGQLTGRIDLDSVSFRYGEDGPLVLRDLSLSAQPGEMVALVGPSGAGKSTVTRLLLGFEHPVSGRILFDGRDLTTLDPTLVRQQMGVVVQSGRITRSTVLRNIVGPTSTDEAAAWEAAEKAAIADEIRAMPMGMSTIVDPTNISGGQAQRLLIARALVMRPKIVILDEATSALDNGAQATVTQALRDMDCTRIVIAHRLSTIRSADRIVVIEAGKDVESGTYDELMEAGGLFASLVRRQTA